MIPSAAHTPTEMGSYAQRARRKARLIPHLISAFRTAVKSPLHDRLSLALVSILVATLALRLYRLDSVPTGLYYDEITSTYAPYLMVQQGLTGADLPSLAVALVSGSFPIYFLFGSSPFFTRLPAVIYGTALVIPLYLLGKRLMNRQVGLVAGVLVAVTPWTLLFSRYGIFASAYAFWVATYIYFLFAYCQTGVRAYRYAFGLAIAASFYTLAMSLPFGFLFAVVAFPALYAAGKLPRRRDPVVLFLYMVAGASPYLVFLAYPSAVSAHAGYSAFQVSHGPADFVMSWLDSFAIHLSPDFLVFTGGKALALSSSPGFTHRIAETELYYYSDAGYNGMLNLYGILVYPAMFWIACRIMLRRGELWDVVLGSWVFCYALTAGYAYFDNPNAARNIEGAGALLLLTAWMVVTSTRLILERLGSRDGTARSRRKRSAKAVVVVAAAVLIAAPTATYLVTYFGTYPALSAPYFDYEYQQAAAYLTLHNLWGKNVYLYDDVKVYGSVDLSFYNTSARNHIMQISNLTQLLSVRHDGQNVLLLNTEHAYNVTLSLGVPATRLATLHYPSGAISFVIATL